MKLNKTLLVFAMVAYDPYAKKENLPSGVTLVDSREEVFRTADFTSLHLPALPETKKVSANRNLR
jgi:D-3-phosphoglycerate dehydrogenase